MKKAYLYLFLFLFCLPRLQAQVDSWRNEIEVNQKDSSLIPALARLADYYAIRDFDSCEYFLNLYQPIAEAHSDAFWQANAWRSRARLAHLRDNDYQKAIHFLDKAFALFPSMPASDRKDSLIAHILVGKGDSYHRMDVPDSALHYYNKLENHLITSGRTHDVWMADKSKAVMYYNLSVFDKALEYAEKAYLGAVKNDAPRSQVGYILFFGIESSLNAKNAAAYDRNIERLISYYELDKKPMQLADSSAQHLSLLWRVTDRNVAPILERAMDSSIVKGDFLRAAIHGKNLAGVYKGQEKWDKAIAALEVSAYMFSRLNMPSLQQKNHMELVDFAKRVNNPELALLHLEAAERLRDSLQKAAHLERISELEIKHETEKKEREIKEKTYQRNLWIGLFTLLGCALFVIVYLLSNRLKLAQKLAEQERSEAARKLELGRYQSMVQAQEAERKRIAGELHDGVGGSLASAQNYLSMLDEQPEKADEFALKSKQLIEESSADIRRISHDLIPLSLKRLGLRAALSDLCSQLSEQHIPCEFEFSGDEKHLTDEQKLLLYRIVQESSNNIRKHAEASQALVQIIIGEDYLDLLVEDDGKGFERDRSSPAGHGLDSLFTRVAMLGGELEIDSVPGEGTSVSVVVKL